MTGPQLPASNAGGCVLLAAWRQARGHGTLIVAATFGQPGTMATMLPAALQAGHQLVLALGRALTGQSAQHTSGNNAGKNPRTGHHLVTLRDGKSV